MPDDSKTDAVERFLSEQKSLEDRKQALIADLLKQKEAAMAAFDKKLAALGYEADSKPKRSHHRRATKSPAHSMNDRSDTKT